MELKEQRLMLLLTASEITGIPYSSLMRYRKRLEAGELPLKTPGPAPVAPPDMNEVIKELRGLRHGKRRTKGTEHMRVKYLGRIPRRELYELIDHIRREINREHNDIMERIRWNTPGSVWSMDDAEYVFSGQKYYIHQVQDMASKYKFPPMTSSRLADGKTVAANLENLFKRFGAPLFIKRDNGGNLNHEAVQKVLEQFHVIPINSPAYYPKYNGSLERNQRDLKEMLDRKVSLNNTSSLEANCKTGHVGGIDKLLENSFAWLVETAANDCNHMSRRVLKGANSCYTFFRNGRYRKNKRKREEVFNWIKDVALDICAESEHCKEITIGPAWRQAAKKWLSENGMITVWRKRQVSPL
jgi:transposase InsO family protein